MLALLIILAVLFFIAIVLSFSLTVYIKITDTITFKIGCFGYKYLIDLDKENEEKVIIKKKKISKPKKKKSNETKSGKKKEVKPETFGETVEIVLSLIKSMLKPAKYLLKRVRITCLRLNMTVCGDEANQTAIAFGAVSAAIYNLLANIDNLIKLKIKCINISPDFVTGEAKYDISFKVKIRLYILLFAGIGIFFKFVANTIKKNNNDING